MSGKKTIDDIVASDVARNSALLTMPDIDTSNPDRASVEYSVHRTKLSTHRTSLSVHRTDLSTDRTEMSKRRTGLSFQRTRMSADRTLMSVIRTALSLISFGFTIFQFFQHLQQQKVLGGDGHSARNFGLALVYLGVGMQVAGIVYHLQFMWGLRQERRAMSSDGLIHAQSRFPFSFTFVVAVLLLMLGIVAGTSLTFNIEPFG